MNTEVDNTDKKLHISFSGFAFVFCLLECSKLATNVKGKK